MLSQASLSEFPLNIVCVSLNLKTQELIYYTIKVPTNAKIA